MVPDYQLILKAKDIGPLLNLSTGRIYQLIQAHTWGPPIKIGRAVYISRECFEAWLKQQEAEHEHGGL